MNSFSFKFFKFISKFEEHLLKNAHIILCALNFHAIKWSNNNILVEISIFFYVFQIIWFENGEDNYRATTFYNSTVFVFGTNIKSEFEKLNGKGTIRNKLGGYRTHRDQQNSSHNMKAMALKLMNEYTIHGSYILANCIY
jgi:hypothetical protein